MVSSLGLLLGGHAAGDPAARAPAEGHSVVATIVSGAVALAWLEVASMVRTAPADFQRLDWWDNVAIYAILVPMPWIVFGHLGIVRRWLASAIGSVWAKGFLIKFVISGNLIHSSVSTLRRQTSIRAKASRQLKEPRSRGRGRV